MALIDVPLMINDESVPRDIVRFLDDADQRIHNFISERQVRISGFVPSDFVTVYQALNALVEADLATGDMFCEWGSGFGVVAMLAAKFDFESYGIEIEGSLVDAARELAEDFGVSVDFIRGSFVPPGGESYLDQVMQSDVNWLSTDVDEAYSELGLSVRDFDVIYAFPWPGEEDAITNLFDGFAAIGSLLLTHNQIEGVRVRRKVLKKRPEGSRQRR